MPAFDFRSEDLARLRRLTFAARLPNLVHQEGGHRNRRSGEGLEFLDYRPYVPGDDPRHVDWNLYGRLRQLVVRVFENPQNLSVSMLVDCSRSMCFGEPISKAAYACRIAAALSYVALNHGERLTVATFGAELGPLLGPLQRKAQFGRVLSYLRESPEGEETRFAECLHEYCSRLQRKGLVIVISDFLMPSGYAQGLKLLLSRGCRLLIFHVLHPLDLARGLDGHLRLRDSETGTERVVFVDESVRQRVRDSAMAYCEGLAKFCRGYGQTYIQASTESDYLELVCHALRAGTGLR
jgi:uncharacterized protein (DUF58 family)